MQGTWISNAWISNAWISNAWISNAWISNASFLSREPGWSPKVNHRR